jgi:adenosine deaminase
MNNQTPLRDELEVHIRKLIKPLKEEDELGAILKVKLTKKEFKVFKNWANHDNIDELLEKLSIDTERYSTLKEKLIKKLNQEKLKQEIMI